MSVVRSAVAFTFLALAGMPAAAQQDSALRAAVRLATEGQGDSARSLVRRRLATTPPADSTFPEVLYSAGVVAANSDTALRYFRRTSVEYSQSPWADRALLRIAQIMYAGGDLNAAYQSANRILADYPFSTIRAPAAFWAGRAQLDLGDIAGACRLLAQAADSSIGDVELANRARFYVQRCQSLPLAQKPDSAPADTSRAAPKTPTAPAAWAVQVSAVRSPASADQAMKALKTHGWDSRVSRDADGFLRVRVGRFRTKAEATRLAADIKRKLGGAPFAVEEP